MYRLFDTEAEEREYWIEVLARFLWRAESSGGQAFLLVGVKARRRSQPRCGERTWPGVVESVQGRKSRGRGRSGTVKKEEVVSRNPNVLNGALVFTGTRVPVEVLIQHLAAGDSLEDFLEGFPGVSREQAVAYLEMTPEAVDALIA